MHKTSLAFLEKLLAARGPSGSEGPVQKVFEARVSPFCDVIERSAHGSVAAIRNPDGKPRVVVTGHADEIGMIVRRIDDNGFLSFRAIGGLDLATLPGTIVDVHTRQGVVPGVIGRKPTHLQTTEERGKIDKIAALYIDIGAANKAAAAAIVRPGDFATFRAGLTRLGKDLVSSKSLDNRSGVFCAAETLRLLAGAAPKACVIALSTVCEEIGGEGAQTAAYELEPDLAFVVDVTFASDQPDVTSAEAVDVSLGKGPTIARGPRLNNGVVELLEKAARRSKVRVQYEVIANRTGTDGDLIYKTRRGVPIGLLGVPCRYMHTPAEVVSLADLVATSKLLAAAISSLRRSTDLSPFSA